MISSLIDTQSYRSQLRLYVLLQSTNRVHQATQHDDHDTQIQDLRSDPMVWAGATPMAGMQ
jgi:hypothetical protein